jgi:hypothetical protein
MAAAGIPAVLETRSPLQFKCYQNDALRCIIIKYGGFMTEQFDPSSPLFSVSHCFLSPVLYLYV